MRWQPVLVVAAICLLAADAAKDDPKDIQGTWTIVSGERGGEVTPADALKDATVIFAGNKFTAKINDRTREGTFKLDPAKKPKTIDVTIDDKDGLGIYELNGDNLKISFNPPGDERPADFRTKEATRQMTLILKRAK